MLATVVLILVIASATSSQPCNGAVPSTTPASQPSAPSGQSCSGGKWSQGDRNVILAAHNKLRSDIAKGLYTAKGRKFPSAANMKKMQWDCDLEKWAQNYANACVYEHSNREDVGENLYEFWNWKEVTPSEVTQKACDYWSDEFQQFGLSSTKMSWEIFGTGVGHATQMAWANSSRLGCGVAICGSEKKEALVVCQYTVQGNMMGESIYTEGKACSKCDSSCDSTTGLCA